jgi:hypothetical protein
MGSKMPFFAGMGYAADQVGAAKTSSVWSALFVGARPCDFLIMTNEMICQDRLWTRIGKVNTNETAFDCSG